MNIPKSDLIRCSAAVNVLSRSHSAESGVFAAALLPKSLSIFCDPATRLNPIDTMLLLRQLQPEQVASLSPPAVARLVATFRERAETLVFANPLLREALSQTASV